MQTKLRADTLTAWRLFLTAHAQIIVAIDKRLAEAGCIPLNWYDVLIELYEAKNRRLRMNELATRVLLTRSGLTRLVDRLEEAGYLTRELDKKDRRGFYAIINEQGIAAMRQAWVVYAEGITDFFEQLLKEDEAKILAGVFSRMVRMPVDAEG
jgi:DNA-binding MarR family transcriptional regulator